MALLPLFDGAGIEGATWVGAPESSSSFRVVLGASSHEPLELRLMGSEGSGNEEVAVIHLELWGR